MRKIILSISFFTITPILLFISIVYFLFLSYDSSFHNGLISRNPNRGVAFAALPSAENVLGDNIISKDARIAYYLFYELPEAFYRNQVKTL